MSDVSGTTTEDPNDRDLFSFLTDTESRLDTSSAQGLEAI
jgi:hypothetical protein